MTLNALTVNELHVIKAVYRTPFRSIYLFHLMLNRNCVRKKRVHM